NINGSTFTISKRLWAFGNYSRFIRPGATRIDATTGDGNLKVSAFRNADGSYAVVVLNGNTADTAVTISLQGVATGSSASPFLTNANSNLAAQANVAISGGNMNVTIPARSLITYSIPAGNSATSTPTNTATNTPTRTNTPTATRTNTPTVQPPTNTPGGPT